MTLGGRIPGVPSPGQKYDEPKKEKPKKKEEPKNKRNKKKKKTKNSRTSGSNNSKQLKVSHKLLKTSQPRRSRSLLKQTTTVRTFGRSNQATSSSYNQAAQQQKNKSRTRIAITISGLR